MRKMRRIVQVLTLVVALAVVLGLLGAVRTTPAQAAVVSNVIVPVTDTVPHPCTGEPVTLSGSAHIVMTQTVDGNGGTHTTLHINAQDISGTTPGGDTYRDTVASNEVTNEQGPAPFETTSVTNANLISQGPTGTSFLAHISIHVTVNANGDVTANVSNISTECK